MVDEFLRFVANVDPVITGRNPPELEYQVATNGHQQDNDCPDRPDSARAVLLQRRFY